MDIKDILLIGFSSGLIGTAIVAGVEEMIGKTFYPIVYNSYQTIYSQLPANAIQVQTAVSNSFQNYVNSVSQVQNSAAIAATLQIAAFMGVFTILLELLMRLLMPRTPDAPSGY